MKTKILYTLIVSLFIIGCKSTQDTNSTTTGTVFDINVQPKPGPAPTINLGKPQTFELPNGLKVMVVENHKLPRVSAILTIDNGLIFEGDKAGVSSLTGQVLGNGTTSISKDDFNEEVDFLGASISFSSQGARMNSLSKYFPKVLGLMVDGALNPLFPQEDFDSQKVQLLEGLKFGEKDVAAVAGQVQGALMYGKNHPKGEFITQETGESVTLEDVKLFYKKYYNPNNAYLIVIGDVNFNEVKTLVTSKFSGWKKGETINYTIPEVTNVAKTEINFVDMPNAVQSNISITNTVSLKKSDPNFYAALLANRILGGGGVARLFQNLRETNGFTYGAYSSLGNDHETASRFSASAMVRNAVTDSSVVEFLNEIKLIKKELVTDEELKIAKASYVGSFVRALEQPSTIAQYALNIETENLPEDYYENYLKNFNAVTTEQVRDAANEYFQDDNLRIIIIGKGVDVIPALKKMSFPVNYFDKEGNSVEAPSAAPTVSADVTTQSILNNYIDAIGGKENAEAVNSIAVSADVTITGVPVPLTAEIKEMAPNKESMELTAAGMGVLMKQKFDGENGYAEQQGMKKDLTPDEIAEKKSEYTIFPELHYDISTLSIEGVEKINGENAYKVKTDGGETSYRFYDIKTGYLVRVESSTEMQGQTISTTVDYSDYTKTGDVLVPFTQSIITGPQNMVFKTTDIKINEGVTSADFE